MYKKTSAIARCRNSLLELSELPFVKTRIFNEVKGKRQKHKTPDVPTLPMFTIQEKLDCTQNLFTVSVLFYSLSTFFTVSVLVYSLSTCLQSQYLFTVSVLVYSLSTCLSLSSCLQSQYLFTVSVLVFIHGWVSGVLRRRDVGVIVNGRLDG